jgi:hypothetical protein
MWMRRSAIRHMRISASTSAVGSNLGLIQRLPSITSMFWLWTSCVSQISSGRLDPDRRERRASITASGMFQQ